MPIDAAKRPFLDIDFADLSFAQVLEEVERRAHAPRFSYIVTPNVDHVIKLRAADGNPVLAEFKQAYDSAILRTCDSRILKRLARLFGYHLPLVAGSDLTAALFAGRFRQGDKVAIIGGADTILPRLSRLCPGINFVQHLPPMGVLRNATAQSDIIRFVQECDANYVFFAIGCPQSEILALRCANAGSTQGVALCVGASIDFVLGDLKRAPVWMQKAGLEWLFRLLSEPGRLWRRYLVEGPRIFLIALKWWREAR